jgi:hypothetical protein
MQGCFKVQDALENLIYSEPLKKAFQELREGSIIHLVVDGEIYKLFKNHAGIKLMPPSGNDKPLLVFKISRDVINSLVNERELIKIKNVLRNLYLEGYVQVKIAAPTPVLIAYRAQFLLRRLGLTMIKEGD